MYAAMCWQECFFFEVTPNFDEEIPLEHLFALFSARRLRELIENIVYLFKGVHKYEMEKRGIFEEFINQKHQLLRCSIN